MSARVLQFPRHYRTRCANPYCECVACAGGLMICGRCEAAEGELPTDCPGEPMTDAQRAEVLAGRLDYRRRGGWICTATAADA